MVEIQTLFDSVFDFWSLIDGGSLANSSLRTGPQPKEISYGTTANGKGSIN
jgi:hypothetical protein